MVENKEKVINQIAKERMDNILRYLTSKDDYEVEYKINITENPNKVDDFTCNICAKEKMPEMPDSLVSYWKANRELNFYIRLKGEITNNFVYFREDRSSTIGVGEPKWDEGYRKFLIYDVNGELLLEKDTHPEKSLSKMMDC